MKSLSMLMATLMVVSTLFTAGRVAADERIAMNHSSKSARAMQVSAVKRVSGRGMARTAKVSCEDLMTFDQASRPQSVSFDQGRVRCEAGGR